MDMSTSSLGGSISMSMAPSSTMSGMSMPSSSDSSMSMESSSMMGMDTMAMTFFTSYTTPLFSMSWSPETIGQYAGTCIFLIIFTIIFRGLLALRTDFYPLLSAFDRRRNGGLRYGPFQAGTSSRPRWRAREATLLGFLDVILAGLGYLLMIAVMTMNVGYFMSILGGVFIGSMILGRFVSSTALQ